MKRTAGAVLLFLALPASARADMASVPRPMWGSPGPRTAVVDGRRTPLPLVRPPRADEPTPVLRDDAVEKRSERVEIWFLRNVIWVRTRVALRAAEGPLRAWPMGIEEHAYRDASLPLHFLAVRVDDTPTPTYQRSIPYSPDRTPDELSRPGYDGWIEWRLDLAPDRDTIVEISFVRPAHWRCLDSEHQLIDCASPGRRLVQGFPYRFQQAERYRDGRGSVELVAVSSGFSGTFERRGVRRPRRPAIPLAVGDVVRIGPDEPGTVELVVSTDSLSERPGRAAEVPGWIALLDRHLDAIPFTPTVARPVAPASDTEGFARRVEELRQVAGEDDPMRSQVAAGLLEALRERLRGEASWVSDGDEGELPAPDALGVFGGRLDTAAWRDALQDAMSWTTPPGAAALELPEEDTFLVEEVEGGGDKSPRPASASAEDRRALLLLLDERYQRPTSSGARQLDPRTDARQLGLEIGPPFGRPNQLVLASRQRGLGWELPAVGLTLLGLIAAAWIARRRRLEAAG